MILLPYMQNALLVGAIVSIVAGVIGFFVVLRGASFATHALAQVGFAGAAGAVLLGIDPIFGLLGFSLLGAGGMGALSTRSGGRDAIIALVMTAALGTGALFLVLNRTYATDAFSLLFGTIVGISRLQVLETAALALLSLVAIGAIYRPLLFATVSPEAARARSVPMQRLDVVFLMCIALAASTTIPTVGTLLIFSLMVAPPAAAALLTDRPWIAIAAGIGLNLACCWGGIVVAYTSGLPVGFLIASFAAIVYVAARVYTTFKAP
ncbi:MAG: metal ABC transporter permease [Candidatus Eremiobacteraeota bacterium]|nr:metal ABC transporter permease [Candidatus Eremiobacteraeota bacterium]